LFVGRGVTKYAWNWLFEHEANAVTVKTKGRRSAVAWVAACLALGGLTPSAAAGAAPTPQGAQAVAGELLVRFEPSTSPHARSLIRARAGTALKRGMLLPGLELLQVQPGVSVDAAIQELERIPAVRYAEPNAIYHLRSVPSDPDPRFHDQWGLSNTGQIVDGFAGTPGADVSAVPAWDTTIGDPNVKVAVLDTGLDGFHPDLAANVWRNPGEFASGELRNGLDDDANGFVDDVSGWDFVDNDASAEGRGSHGTGVAGVVGAGRNGLGVVGVTWRVSLIPLTVCDGAFCKRDLLADAVTYAGRIGADVANMSFGGVGEPSQAVHDAFASTSNTLFVAAAPNESVTVGADYPCVEPFVNVLCVTGTDKDDQLRRSWHSSQVDLAAPSENVLSLGNVYREVFADTFEDPIARWDYTQTPMPADPARWRRVAVPVVDGGASTHAIEDSELADYPSNADVSVTLRDPIDLSNERGCSVTLDTNLATESARDHLRIEAASAASGPWRGLAKLSGSTFGRRAPVSASLSEFEGASVFLRLRLTSDAQNNANGASVDNVRVLCDDPERSYGFASGNSFAAPHVSGAAALVKAHMPGLSPAQVRERLLRTVDRLPSLEGKVASGGRLNVARALTADLTPPTTTIQGGPSGLTNSRTATFGFEASKAGSTSECRLDGGEFEPCVSSKAYVGLADGEHSFSVRATDEFGIVGASAQRTWSVDATAPAVTIASGPAGSTTSRSATFAFSASEAGVVYECSLDGATPASCVSPVSYASLAVGSHTFAVTARDATGNVSAAASRAWTIIEETGGEEPPPGPTPPSEQPATSVLAPPSPVAAPRLEDPFPSAWVAPRLAVTVPRQTLARVLRAGLATRTLVRGACPCRLTQALWLDRRLARTSGIPARSTRRLGAVIARRSHRLRRAGVARTMLPISRPAAMRLRNLRRLDGWLETRTTDRRGLATIQRQQIRVWR
jgi:subtilisin family serine protease